MNRSIGEALRYVIGDEALASATDFQIYAGVGNIQLYGSFILGSGLGAAAGIATGGAATSYLGASAFTAAVLGGAAAGAVDYTATVALTAGAATWNGDSIEGFNVYDAAAFTLGGAIGGGIAHGVGLAGAGLARAALQHVGPTGRATFLASALTYNSLKFNTQVSTSEIASAFSRTGLRSVINTNANYPPLTQFYSKYLSNSVTVRESKWDYFFGLVTSNKHNLDRSLSISHSLRKAGFSDTIESRTGLTRLFEIGRNFPVTEEHITKYGTTLTRQIPLGDIGHLDVKYFYREWDLSVKPEISSLIVKEY